MRRSGWTRWRAITMAMTFAFVGCGDDDTRDVADAMDSMDAADASDTSDASDTGATDAVLDTATDTATDTMTDTLPDTLLDTGEAFCASDTFVSGNECVACPPGTINDAGDDPSGADTMCDAVLCAMDEFVNAHMCMSCPAGTANEAGDAASGADTMCDPLAPMPCAIDEFVSDNECVACPPGTTNEAGDDARGADTSCDPTLCDANEFVFANVCVACPAGELNEPGDDASGADTICDADACFVALGIACEEFREAYIKASNTEEFDDFGGTAALSADGETLAVGAFDEDSAATGIDGDQASNDEENSGAVYIFRRTAGTWAQEAYVKASNSDRTDSFARSLSLSSDGSTLAVGAPGEDSLARGIGGDQTSEAATASGAVYVFQRSGGAWSQQAYVKASNADARDTFGGSVALSGNGLTLAVGAAREGSSATGVGGDEASFAASRSGAVYVFQNTAGTWAQQAYVKASNTDEDDEFGSRVTLSSDGATLAVSALGESSAATGVGGDQMSNAALDSGAVYVFQNVGGTWAQQAYLKASNTEADDRFGWGLALSSDGATLAVSADQESSTSTGIDGDQGNGALHSGAVYVFRQTAGAWAQEAYVKASNSDGRARFGSSVSLSSDGATLAVGAIHEGSSATDVGGDETDRSAPRAGAVYLFQRSGGAWAQHIYVKASNTDTDDYFGVSVSLSADASLLVVGAGEEDSDATGVDGDEGNNDERGSGAAYLRRLVPE